MAEHKPDAQSDPEGNGQGHESVSVSAKGIAAAGFALITLVGVSMALMVWLAMAFSDTGPRKAAPVSGLEPRRRLPPAPGVEPNQEYQRREQQARKQEVLDSYGYVDRSREIARIPIQRAMELVSERGLDPWSGPEQNQDSGPEERGNAEKDAPVQPGSNEGRDKPDDADADVEPREGANNPDEPAENEQEDATGAESSARRRN